MMLLGPGGGYSNVLEGGSSPLEDPGVYRQERGSNTQSQIHSLKQDGVGNASDSLSSVTTSR
jgi:hypothetical protein